MMWWRRHKQGGGPQCEDRGDERARLQVIIQVFLERLTLNVSTREDARDGHGADDLQDGTWLQHTHTRKESMSAAEV